MKAKLNLTPLTHDFLQVAAAEASRDLQAGSHARVVASVISVLVSKADPRLRRSRFTEIRGLRSARGPRAFVASTRVFVQPRRHS